MTKETFQLSDSAVAVYEDQKVTAMFGPLARATLGVVPVAKDDTVLDVACGTGIVARSIFEKFGPVQPIVGTDLNDGMIGMARHVTRDAAHSFEWHVADVEKLPFETGRFSLVICQQGIQYFPDEQAALKEIRRVMASGGRLVMSVWGGASDFFLAMAESVGRHVDPDVGARYLAPFSYKNTDRLPEMLASAGFRNVVVETLTVDRTMTETVVSLPKEILAHPAGSQVQAAGEAAVQAIAGDVSAACSKYQHGNDMIVPQRAHLFSATAT